ncbi:hypothetical protein GCM10029964_103020 [Kibdelosporangium lantanae]
MDLTPYVENLRQEVAVAAEAGGDEARALVERLTAPVEAAIRLTLLEALSAAADEITIDLAPGSVDVRLRGRDATFVVNVPPAEPREVPMAPVAPPVDTDEGATARINFRLPEHLKARVEQAAGDNQLSVNAWLTRVVAAALDQTNRHRPMPPAAGQNYTGWAR